MRWYTILACLVLFLAGPVRASLEELAAALPACAVISQLPCFTEAISQSSCAPTNQTCMCTDEDFTGMVELCVAESCSIREALTTKNVSSTSCGAPIRDRTKAVSITGLAGGALALLAFVLRIIARLPCCGGKIGMDDWTMALTMLCVIPISILSYVLAEDGLGKDLWVVPFDNITHILYIYFFDECLYLTGIALTKISILCFYLRVFPRREFRRLVYIAIGINVAYIIVFDLISIFQCRPVQGAWYRWDETGDYKCNNINAQGWSSAAFNMALDIMVMALPLKELYGLNLSWRKKAFVICMFSLGIFVTLVSVIRLESLIVFANTTNLTWDYVQIGYWSTIEIHVGVICACLPAIRALFRRIWPRMFGDTAQGISKGSRSRSVGTGANTPQNTNTTEYDYIVVGSGAGGGPLAARLARAGHSVLLLDAGDDQGDAPQQMIPAMQLHSTEYEPMRWDYFVNHYDNLTRQEEDSKMVYRAPTGELYTGAGEGKPEGAEALGILYPRAGTLGGCTAHNAMIAIYPYERDWDELAELTGNDSWSASNMRNYFKRLEDNRYAPSDIVSHGFGGWLQTSLTQLTLVVEDLKLLSLVIAAGTAMGQNLVGKILNTVTGLTDILLRDLNTGAPWRDQREGLFQVPLAVKVPEYRRTGPRDFLLDTVDEGYHLDIQLTTLVTNVIFDTSGATPRAIGVDYLHGQSLYRADPRAGTAATGTPGKAYAKKEVILSTGTFNTPQILKLSGVGPRAELSSHNIPVLVDLPGVGHNMQDRYETTLIGKSPTDFTLTSKCTFLESLPDPCYEDWKNGIGFKGTYMTNGIAIAILKQSSVAEHDEPDLLISGAPGNFPGYYPGYAHDALKDAQHWAWIVLKARSRNNAGTVRLRSTDPRDTPVINFHSFDEGITAGGADQKDLQAMYEAMQFSREIFDNLVPLDGDFDETWPGANVSSEDAMKDFIKREAWGHHACCTAAIGADEDPMAVLDGDFRVRGVDGLRVVDASVFPKIPGYYIVLPIYMVSEKAADVILADAGRW
ncbi:GMC oxidoreductase [Aspergillus carlsbadensis]|nr:GMC oxidoreductase [Aspergillus carlsbadensis]